MNHIVNRNSSINFRLKYHIEHVKGTKIEQILKYVIYALQLFNLDIDR